MRKVPRRGPQGSLLFRTIAFFSRLQLRYLLQNVGNPHMLVVIFVFVAGASALGIITVAAYLTRLPLLFPPLGPSAYILFHTPMSVTASPRNVSGLGDVVDYIDKPSPRLSNIFETADVDTPSCRPVSANVMPYSVIN